MLLRRGSPAWPDYSWVSKTRLNFDKGCLVREHHQVRSACAWHACYQKANALHQQNQGSLFLHFLSLSAHPWIVCCWKRLVKQPRIRNVHSLHICRGTVLSQIYSEFLTVYFKMSSDHYFCTLWIINHSKNVFVFSWFLLVCSLRRPSSHQ